MRLVWSEIAIADLWAIHSYIARDSATYASQFVDRLIAATDPLESFPQLGRVVPEGEGRHRELLVGPYRIVYRQEADAVIIVTVVHGRRDLTGMRDT